MCHYYRNRFLCSHTVYTLYTPCPFPGSCRGTDPIVTPRTAYWQQYTCGHPKCEYNPKQDPFLPDNIRTARKCPVRLKAVWRDDFLVYGRWEKVLDKGREWEERMVLVGEDECKGRAFGGKEASEKRIVRKAALAIGTDGKTAVGVKRKRGL